MKAYYSTRYGGPEYSFYGVLPDIIAQPGEILVEIKAVSINPVDYKIMKGIVRFISGTKFPKIFGTDFAGIIKEIPDGVSGFETGDRVYGSATIITGRQGALAELLSVKPERLRKIPMEMSFEEAASLPVAALTALNGLRRSGVKAGSRVFINGATGGVGHFAVQIAKAKGAYVTATCSSSNAGLAKQLGADEVSGYEKDDLLKAGEGYDAILDAYGKMDYADVCRLLKKGGVYTSTLFFNPLSFISSFFIQIISGKKLTSANMRAKPEDYDELELLFRDKKLIPLIENIFPLSKCGDAFYHAEYGKPRGKVIVTV
jgi:NADPH:quinone reductase-like Zn-dependent oxidoreductase